MELETMNDVVEVKPKNEIKFIKETLTRMGIANRKKQVLFPSCYLVNGSNINNIESNNKYYIVHFKQLFYILRDDGYNNMSVEDYERRNAIIFCLKNWNLIDVDENNILPHNKHVFVLPYKEKQEWIIKHKFNTLSINKKI